MMIRAMRGTDVDACTALMRSLPLWRRHRGARAAFAGVRGRTSRGRVAEDAGRVIGFIVYSLEGTFDHSGYVRAIGVAAGAQGQGVGARLMDAAEEEILRRGPNVFLLVSSTNAGARRFYERRGYRRIGEIPDYVRRGITELLYRKTRGPIRRG